MVLRANEFKINSVQVVAFTPSHSDFKASSALAAILGKYAKRFDGNVQSLPLGDDAPVDFPRIQLASRDGLWEFSASPSRVASIWKRKQDDDNYTLEQLVNRCQEPIEHHIRENEIRVGRMALVLTRFVASDNPAQELINRFCNDEVKDDKSAKAPLRHSKTFEIHNHKRYSLSIEGLAVNSWVRCRTGSIIATDTPAVTVEQDINTLREELEERAFSVENFGLFLSTVTKEADLILNKYFPPNQE